MKAPYAIMGTILLVDDNRLFRLTMRRILELDGHKVTEAENGLPVVKHLESLKQHFDLMITDINMPEQDGIETIIQVRRGFPALKIIAISGRAHSGGMDLLRMAKQLGASEVLRKPFEPAALRRVVKACLGEKGAT
jgi:CheY-like chemotaxis protein